ncbi:MAG: polynucleotide adenylyltransferase PcnB [Chromatiales bacterium]|nr:polynucleotide adenylyltransferase PcnB [Chromatiales bacterium]
MLKWFKKRTVREAKGVSGSAPHIIGRDHHNISRKNISRNALKVLYKLNEAGYASYLVGGGVRDLLLERRPKDFDIATDATPEQVKHLFRNSRLIGRRFRLAHVFFGRDIIEVATFRGPNVDNAKTSDQGMILRDNDYGTLEEDAWRRDFSINALYYNIDDFSVVDYTGGVPDVKAKNLRIIGEPEKRFREDPVRMLRAVRFAAKLDFRIEKRCEKSIDKLGGLLEDISSARLFDESTKLFLSGHGVESFYELRHYDLFYTLYPEIDELLDEHPKLEKFIEVAMRNSDRRIANNQPVTPAFLIAVLLWPEVKQRADGHNAKDGAYLQALQQEGDHVLHHQQQRTAAPRRFTAQAREIWVVQQRLIMRRQPYKIFEHPRFRAAYDFLLLRAESGETELQELADWWTRFQEVEGEERKSMVNSLGGGGQKKRRRKKRKPKTNDGQAAVADA